MSIVTLWGHHRKKKLLQNQVQIKLQQREQQNYTEKKNVHTSVGFSKHFRGAENLLEMFI